MKNAILLCAGVLSLAASAAELRLDSLRTQLNRRDAAWSAGPTSVSRLTAAEKRQLLGARLPEGFAEPFLDRTAPVARASEVFDWRNRDGVSFASPMLNQGRCGSCVAFAAIGTLETQLNITRNTPNSPWALSPQSLFSCGGGGCASGWWPHSAVSFLKSSGVPDEACFPYSSGALAEDVACNKGCSNTAARSLRLTGSTTPTSFFVSKDAVKAALRRGPLMTTMQVYEDFYYYTGGVYKHVTGPVVGGHAVSLVGWSDPDRAWIIRNSWGEEWGDKGFGMISWDDSSGVGSQTWGMEVPAEKEGYVTLGSLRDHDVLSGVQTLAIESTYPGTKQTEFTLTKQGLPVAWGDASPGRGFSLDTAAHEDGVYELVATAHHAKGTAQSAPRIVYLLNGELTGALAFRNVTAGQTISGAKAFPVELSTASAPVPFSRVTFRARHVASGELFARTTPNVASKMALSWRTNKLPKGEWELTLTGSAGAKEVVSAPIRVTVGN